MNNNKRTIRNISVGFIAFMCSILLVGLTLILMMERTIMSADFLNKAAVKSDYYTALTKQVTVQIQDIGLGSGIPQDVLEEVVDVKQVQRDFESYSYQAYMGNALTIEQAPFLEQISGLIYDYGATKGQKLTPENVQGVKLFSEKSYDVYSDFINLPYLPAVGQRIQAFASNLVLLQVILGVSVLLMLMLIVYLLHGWWHRLLRYMAYIFSGSGLMLIVLPALILWSGIIKRVSIASPPLYKLITTYLSSSLLVLIYVGGAFLLISLIFAGISTILRKHQSSVKMW